MDQIRLTEYSHDAGGCGCGIEPAALREILAYVPRIAGSANLNVEATADDAAATCRINDQQTLVVANGFIPPIVDDPDAFGRIAAASALGSVYAMGATPILAVPVAGFPVNELPLRIMQEVLRGGVEACADAGIPLAGGHSIDNAQPFFGLSVAGLMRPEWVRGDSGARIGDVLILTKPLGVGILTTAVKVGAITPVAYERLLSVMSTLNTPGTWLSSQTGVHALAAVGGLGLAGEAVAMARRAGASIVIEAGKVPVIAEAWDLATLGTIPRAAHRNLSAVGAAVSFDAALSHDHQLVFTDPQISGGLLVAVAPDAAAWVIARLKESRCLAADVIGRFVPAAGAPGVCFEGSA